MTRRPTPEAVLISATVPRGYQGYWRIIRRLDNLGPWSVRDVAQETNARTENVHEYIRRLAVAGFCAVKEERRVAPGAFPQKLYRLIKKPTDAPRVRKDGSICPPTGQEQMWRALRQLGTVSADELVHAASTDEVVIDRAAVLTYVSLLASAGYLQDVQPGTPKGGPRRVRLKPSMDTGPLPPMVMRTKVVWDQNKGCAMGVAELEEVRS